MALWRETLSEFQTQGVVNGNTTLRHSLSFNSRLDGFSHATATMRRVVLWGPPVLYMILIYRLSANSDPLPMVTAHVHDSLLHASEYAALALLLTRALAGEGLGSVTACVSAALLTIAYGATDEYHQWFVPMRTSDVRDWLADVVGAAAGGLGFVLALRARARVTRVPPGEPPEPD
jgi:VanZ family protein